MPERVERPDRYAGDAAWREWFEICSVSGCAETHRAALAAEVSSAMYAQLVRRGLTREDAGDEDPVAFFDAYFKLKGCRETGKPLKLYFAHRIAAEGIRLSDFVCGTLFGSRSGRVRDIVVDWIVALKGWKARTEHAPEGGRRLVWENAADETAVRQLLGPDFDPAPTLDLDPLRQAAEALLAAVARKIRVEKRTVALLLYVTAQDIPVTEGAVLAALGVGKSRAYKLRDRIVEESKREMSRIDGADAPAFPRLLLERCERETEGLL